MQKGASCGRIAAGTEQSFFVPGPPVQLGGEAPEGSQTAAGVENAVDPGLRSRQRSSRTREVGFAEQNVKGENGRGSGFFPAPGSGNNSSRNAATFHNITLIADRSHFTLLTHIPH